MTRDYREYAKSRIEYLLKICKLDERDKEAVEAAIQALSQEPCDDAISREAAINIASLHCLTIDESVKAIKNLPSVTQKSGKWIEEVNDFGEITKYHCSKCYEDTGFTTDCKWKFCPNCGAKMESEE